jgi:hypothetical protein
MKPILLFTISLAAYAETVPMKGLQQPVEILRDKWGVPHIYAKTTDDLFFAQGYTAARDRLFQIDLWRRMNTGKMAEVPDCRPWDVIALRDSSVSVAIGTRSGRCIRPTRSRSSARLCAASTATSTA